MIENVEGQRQPEIGTQTHWNYFRMVAEHADLFDPIRTLVEECVEAEVRASPNRAYLDARRICEKVLTKLDSWWHGEFPRRFSQLQNGVERGVVGMTLWNYLAKDRPEIWQFTAQEDSHGYGQCAMQYWLKNAGN